MKTDRNISPMEPLLPELHPVHRMTAQRTPFTRGQVEEGNLKNLYLSTDWGLSTHNEETP